MWKSIPDGFVTRKILYSVEGLVEFIVWYNEFKQRKVYIEEIYKDLMSIAWHPSRMWDWCIPEDEKTEIEKLWKNESDSE